MGSQANMELVKNGLDVLESIFKTKQPTYDF